VAAPLLGREYAYPVLRALGENGQATFTGLLTELDISRATLSVTLQDLVKQSYVHKETLGKYSIYRLKEKGSQELARRGGSEPFIERLALYIFEKMRDKGQVEPDAEREEVLAAIREKAHELIDQVAKGAARLLKEKEEHEL
jgi:DNA-binding PadR family transcriptional regulator